MLMMARRSNWGRIKVSMNMTGPNCTAVSLFSVIFCFLICGQWTLTFEVSEFVRFRWVFSCIPKNKLKCATRFKETTKK